MSAPKRTYKIAAIPADGVGIEVVAAGRTVLDALAAASDGAFAFDWTEFPWGSDYYAERMVLSQDAACYIDWIDPNVLPFLPQWHYLHIHDEVLPYAREHGVTEEQIATMLTANPRRLFEQTR